MVSDPSLSDLPFEITDELLRTTGHMNNFCLREFVFMFFNPIELSNLLKLHLPGIKGAIPTALLCIERCS